MINIKEFTCECGRIFYGPQSFNGHQSHCRIHLGEEKYLSQLANQNKAQKIAVQAVKEKSKNFHKQKEIELQQWIDEQHRCERCNNVMTEKYGSGRFCSKSCANSRKHTDESRLKVSQSLSNYYTISVQNNKGKSKFDFSKYIDGTKELYLTKQIKLKHLSYYEKDKIYREDFVICPYCNIRMSHLQPRHLQQHNKTTQNLHDEFGDDYQIICNKSLQKRSLASKILQEKLIKDGLHKGWQSRNIKSYAEKFWQKVLDNNKIPYDDEHVVRKRDLGLNDSGNYFLDFLLPGNIDLEIDGKQHKYKDRKQHDIERDKILKQNGFIVFRIPWVNPKNKNKVKEQIDVFLDWYYDYKGVIQ